MRTEIRKDRGYELSGVHNPPNWQVQVVAGSPNLPSPSRLFDIVCDPDKEKAFALARAMVNQLLA